MLASSSGAGRADFASSFVAGEQRTVALALEQLTVTLGSSLHDLAAVCTDGPTVHVGAQLVHADIATDS
eukprot:3290593-Amphidinium_carterae.1